MIDEDRTAQEIDELRKELSKKRAHEEHIELVEAIAEQNKLSLSGDVTLAGVSSTLSNIGSGNVIANTSFVHASQHSINNGYNYGPGSIVVDGHGEIAQHNFNGSIKFNPEFIANQIIETSVPIAYGSRSHNFCIQLLELLKALPLEKKQKAVLNIFADDTVTSYRNLDDEELINYLKLTL